jgi:hypothetical protein
MLQKFSSFILYNTVPIVMHIRDLQNISIHRDSERWLTQDLAVLKILFPNNILK